MNKLENLACFFRHGGQLEEGTLSVLCPSLNEEELVRDGLLRRVLGPRGPGRWDGPCRMLIPAGRLMELIAGHAQRPTETENHECAD